MFSSIIKEYKNRINSVIEVSPFSLLTMNFLRSSMELMFQKFLDEQCTKVQKNEEETTYNIPIELHYQYKKMKRHSNQMSIAKDQLSVSYFINLVAQYDHFYGSLLRCLFKAKPEMLNSIDKKVELSDLLQFQNLDEAKEHFLDKEVESILRDSHIEQIKYLEKKLKIKLTKDLSSWPEFVEICERRNLLVHCDGFISNQYLDICKKHTCDINDKQLKQKLNVTQEYLKRACFVLLEIGLKLAFVTWNKVIKDNSSDIASLANEIIYDYIDDGYYDFAISISEFILLEAPFKFKEPSKLPLVINLAQSYKWSGEEQKKTKLLDEYEWTTKSIEYQLSYNVLNDDFDNAFKLMKEISTSNRIAKYDYLAWPLFKEFRKQPDFNKIYTEIFGEAPKEIVNKKKSDDEANGDSEVESNSFFPFIEKFEKILNIAETTS